MIQRLHSFWEKKWLKIQERKLQKQKIEDNEIEEREKKIKEKNIKKNEETFKRLIKPRREKIIVERKEQEKNFSIAEAIKSGKRLMNAKKYGNVSGKNEFYDEKIIKKIREKIRKNTKNKEVSKKFRMKEIDEIVKKCRNKVLNCENKKIQKLNSFTISTTSVISLIPRASTASSPFLGEKLIS